MEQEQASLSSLSSGHGLPQELFELVVHDVTYPQSFTDDDSERSQESDLLVYKMTSFPMH